MSDKFDEMAGNLWTSHPDHGFAPEVVDAIAAKLRKVGAAAYRQGWNAAIAIMATRKDMMFEPITPPLLSEEEEDELAREGGHK